MRWLISGQLVAATGFDLQQNMIWDALGQPTLNQDMLAWGKYFGG